MATSELMATDLLRIVTDIPGRATSPGSIAATFERRPDGRTSTSSPACQIPPATWPA